MRIQSNHPKMVIMIPTYNEIESIGKLISEISKIDIPNIEINILVIDDNSPDGTADHVELLNLNHVKVLRRTAKKGLGKAYLAGIHHVLGDESVTHLISMDADGSHRVKDLEKLIRAAIDNPQAALIVGSRWIEKGGIMNWPFYRKWLSKAGTAYARRALQIDISDLTGGFKIYPRWAIEKLDLNKITSNGYCFQIEMAYAFSQLSAPIIEIPIIFIERESGHSKMSQRIVLEAMFQVTKWGLTLRTSHDADKLHYVK